MALKEAAKELVYLKRFTSSIDFLKSTFSSILLTDSQSAIGLSKNPVFHKRNKHIEIQYHYVRDMVEKGEIDLEFVPTNQQLADALTKPIPSPDWAKFTSRIGLTNLKED